MGLITDFGLADSYVSEMHAVLIGLCSDIRIIDINHLIEPGNISAGSYLLGRSVPSFPKGSVFLGVVDPEVGTERQAVVVENAGCYFVGPDNGLFSRAIDWTKPIITRVCTKNDVGRETISSTFHGRDLFAPLAAKLVNGEKIESIGVASSLNGTPAPDQPTLNSNDAIGEVIYIDRFGNIATNLPNGILQKNSLLFTRKFCNIRNALTYSSVSNTNPFWLFGSDGNIEIAMNGQHAAKEMAVRVSDTVHAKRLLKLL